MIEIMKDLTIKIEEGAIRDGKSLLEPEILFNIDEGCVGYDIEIYLPDVKKETVNLRVERSFLIVTAENEKVRYIGSHAFHFPVIPELTESRFGAGRLKIYAPIEEKELIDLKYKK